MHLRSKNKQPATKPSKRSRSESSSRPEPNTDVELGNTYLFRDDDAYQMFLRFGVVAGGRRISNCYYFDPKQKIPHRYLTKINGWINHFHLRELATTTDIYSAHTTRLFYANLRFNNTDNATSYFQGREIDVSFRKLAELLSMEIGTERIYVHKNWPWHEEHEKCQETQTDYRKWFGYGTRKDFYLTDIPALHRVAHLLVNNILTPKSQLKTNIETGGLFYMRHMIAMDDLNLNIPYILISHMHKAYSNSRDSLPYGNLIHRILRDQGIEDPLFGVPKDEHKQPKNILDYFSGWVKSPNDMLVPPSSDRRNGFLITPGAVPNQYYPLGEEPPAPEPEPEPESVPAQGPTYTASSSQTGNPDLVSLMTSQFQTLGNQFTEFRTEFGTFNTTLTGYGETLKTHDQHYTDFRKTLEGYGEQLTTFGTRLDGYGTQLDGYGTQLTDLRKDMETGFAEIREDVKKCNKTMHSFWSEFREAGSSQGRHSDDDD